MSMPFAARLRRLSWYAAIHRSRNGPPRLMSSCTGTLSTTDQLRPDASTSSLRSAMASAVHGSPLGTSCRAVTTPVAPVCLMSARVIGSFGPYHRHVCSIQCLLSPSRLSKHLHNHCDHPWEWRPWGPSDTRHPRNHPVR